MDKDKNVPYLTGSKGDGSFVSGKSTGAAKGANSFEDKLTYALETMTYSFKELSALSKQNNKACINDLPFFEIIKEPGNNKNIIPLTECFRFLQIIDTQTDMNDFTDAG